MIEIRKCLWCGKVLQSGKYPARHYRKNFCNRSCQRKWKEVNYQPKNFSELKKKIEKITHGNLSAKAIKTSKGIKVQLFNTSSIYNTIIKIEEFLITIEPNRELLIYFPNQHASAFINMIRNAIFEKKEVNDD